MNRRRFKIFLITAILSFSITAVWAQDKHSSEAHYKNAVELFDKQMYVSAQDELRKAASSAQKNDRLLRSNIDYLTALCAIRTGQNDAAQLLDKFISDYPENPNVNTATFEYGKYFFNKKDYEKARHWFSRTVQNQLTVDERTEYAFKTGYCYWEDGDYERAVTYFNQIRNKSGQYAEDARYYYSHIQYEQKNYDEALKGFNSLVNNPEYSSIVPFYIIQINFVQKKYDEVIKRGEQLITKAPADKQTEIARLIAESYYYKKNYTKATEYFTIYEKNTPQLTREDYYLKGMIQYFAQSYSQSVLSLSEVTKVEKDSVAQNAYYHRAASYIQTGDKTKAMDDFFQAAEMGFDKEITEDALYNYAKLSLELNKDGAPLTRYIELYPNSSKTNDMQRYLAVLYFDNKEYGKALSILQKIKNPGEKEKAAIQTTAYLRGLELMRGDSCTEASKLFALSQKYASSDANIAAQVTYWNAEADFCLGNFAKAKTTYSNIIKSATSAQKRTQEYKIAHYNLAYCCFKLTQYNEAITWFNKYIELEKNNRTSEFVADAHNRIGDCNFKQRNYTAAANSYEKAHLLGVTGSDYALYQKGLSLGLASKDDQKIHALELVEREYPNSPYVPAAWYEIGRTHMQNSNYDKAIAAYQQVTTRFTDSEYYLKSLLDLGLIEVNRENTEAAIAYYREVIAKAPGTTEEASALAALKDLYVSTDRTEDYFAVAESTGRTESVQERDSLSFSVAEKYYLTNDCDKAQPALKKYLEDYPQGAFATAANFYLGDCAYRNSDNDNALQHFTYVVNQPKGSFTELALLGSARVKMEQKNYPEAITAYEQLEEMTDADDVLQEISIALMRANFALKKYKQSFDLSEEVLDLNTIQVKEKDEATFIKARSMQELGDKAEALPLYRELAKEVKTAEGAESKYRAIQILYEQGRYADVEKEVFSFAEMKSPQQYWVASSFIILGDTYVKKKEIPQAKATYQSLVDGYTIEGDDIVTTAKQRLDELNKN